jgi:hypothetical protein
MISEHTLVHIFPFVEVIYGLRLLFRKLDELSKGSASAVPFPSGEFYRQVRPHSIRVTALRHNTNASLNGPAKDHLGIGNSMLISNRFDDWIFMKSPVLLALRIQSTSVREREEQYTNQGESMQ